jgi:diguanylate cyclase (GGDEF)-like protein
MRSLSIMLRVAIVAVGPAVIVSMLLTPIVGWMTALAGEITDLSDEVKRIEEGGLQFRCRPQGSPELQGLVHHINNIVRRLENTQAKKREQVREERLYLEQSNRALLDLASRDTLTGLSNRRRLEKELERQISLSRDSRRPLAVIMMDLDKFKLYNDTAGHLAGDNLLKTVSDTLRSRTRVTDLVVRWGGDEFCILIACSNTDGALAAAQGLVEAVTKAIQTLPQSDAVAGLGASAGVACFPDDAEDAQELIARADDALYRVKESGRGHAARASNE